MLFRSITSAETAILTYYSTDDDTQIFIIKQGQKPELFTCKGQGFDGLQLWLQKTWSINDPNWRSQMPRILAEVSQRLQLSDLVTQHLKDIEELIILPHLYLHQIPFAALPLTADAKGEVLGDKFVIRSIPSCQILKYCVDRHPITEHTYGTVEDADGSLFGARYEGEQIAHINQIHADNRLRGQTQATRANYRQLLTRVTSLHSSHHAASRLDNPLESALKLADGSITLGDLLLGQRYPNLDEVFLSACETHVGKTTLTDDVTTLNTAFLCIGARSVQSTLWSVDDLVTALFDIFYHQFRQDGMNRAVALQQAQIRLRNLSGDEFKLDHYPKLSAYFSQQIVPYITQLEQQISDLNTKKLTVTGEEQTKIRGEIDELERRCDRANSIWQTFENYCEKSRPFRDPYYWAAFITQGMA